MADPGEGGSATEGVEKEKEDTASVSEIIEDLSEGGDGETQVAAQEKRQHILKTQQQLSVLQRKQWQEQHDQLNNSWLRKRRICGYTGSC